MGDYFQQIEKLVNEKKYQQAYQMCLQLINATPNNKKAIKLKSNIEKLVEEQNINAVENDIAKLKPLWREEKYGELVEKLQILYGYAPHYPKVIKLFDKAQKLYQKQKINETNAYIENIVRDIKSLVNEEKYQEAIQKEQLLKGFIPSKPALKNIIFETRRKYVNYLLEEKNEFLQSDKFKEIFEFLEKLSKIDPTYTKISQLNKYYRQKYFASQSNKEKEYIFQGLENLKTLFFKKKYDKVISGAKEILQVHPKNQVAKKLLHKSIIKRNKLISKLVIKQIINNYAQFKTEIKNKPQKFIRL